MTTYSLDSVTTDEWWDWNGIPLNQPYWNVASFGGSRQDLPLLRGQNYVVAYRGGQMWRPKQPDQRTVSLAMWAAGVDQASLAPAADQRLAFNDNFQQLRSMFWAQGNLGSSLGYLTRRWYLTPGGPGIVAATAQAEIAGTMQPTMSGRAKADFTVDFLLADPYFYGERQQATLAPNGTSVITNPGDAAVGFGQQAGFGGTPFTITCYGPLTAPIRLSNESNGVWVTLDYTIPAGQVVTLDVLGYTAFDNLGASHLGVVSHSYAARPWMLLMGAAQNGGQNALLFTTGAADAGKAVVSFQPGFL